jgi:hypothetical protein
MSDDRKVQEAGSEGTALSCRLVFGGGGVSVRVHCVDFGSSGYASIRSLKRVGVGVSIEGFVSKMCQSGCDEYGARQMSELESPRRGDGTGCGGYSIMMNRTRYSG